MLCSPGWAGSGGSPRLAVLSCARLCLLDPHAAIVWLYVWHKVPLRSAMPVISADFVLIPMLLTVRLPAHFQPPTFLACKLQAACAVSPHYVRTSKSTHLVKGCERVKPCCHHVHVIGPGWTAGAESMADPLAAPRTARSRLSGSERAFARIAPSPPSALPSTHWRRRCTLTPLHVLCAPFRDSLFYVPPQMGLPTRKLRLLTL